MKITFIGATHEVTGSAHYLEACGKHMLVDFGMEQGQDRFENVPLPVPESMIDYVFLTHAHVDHSGMLPALYARGFRGWIYTTQATADLCSIMLRDCAHIQMQEAEWRSRKAKRGGQVADTEPVYTMEDAEGTIKRLKPCPYKGHDKDDGVVDVAEGIKIRFTDIGHLLGSASIEVWLKEGGTEKKIVFSGDIGNMDQPLIKDPGLTKEADYVVVESTYGDRLHPADRLDYVSELTRILEETFAKGGNVVIPSFAVGRTQEMLYFFRKIKEDHLVRTNPDFRVYVDSPLAVEATGIFHKNEWKCFDEEALALVEKGINPIHPRGLSLSITSDESKAINFEEMPKVIISASGMCEAGRIRHHLKHNLWRGESTILFVGYQAAGTLGRAIVDGVRTVKLFGETIEVRASVKQLAGLSGHADKDGLLAWLHGFEKKPEQVFVVHGEDGVCGKFVECLEKEHGMKAYAPYSGTCYNLLTGVFEHEAAPVAVSKKAKEVSGVFARLLAAAQRLLETVQKSEGLPRKATERFAKEIEKLCDSWEVR